MNRKLMVLAVALMAAAMLFATELVSAKQPEVAYNPTSKFTQIRGTLDGAGYEILIPDNWQGSLIVACRGFSPEEPEVSDSNLMHSIGKAFVTSKISPGYACAWSTYGEGGFCVKDGMIRTHQLTEYVLDNYDVTGSVLLVGLSMGGEIVCMLGEKYPDLYDGVLDICGLKDVASVYEYSAHFASLGSPSEIRSYLNGPPAYLPPSFTDTLSDSTLMAAQAFHATASQAVATACGGLPEDKPQAYEKLSPTYHANLNIPVISLIGGRDYTVPILQFDMYYDAVAEAGCLDSYRVYTVLSGGHCDMPMWAATFSVYFPKLVAWVGGTVPNPTPAPLP